MTGVESVSGTLWQTLRILVVEDDVDLHGAMYEFLVEKGAKVFSAKNGVEALEIVKSEPLDIVLSDVQMPKMDGAQLLRKIRELNPLIPIVLLATGQSQLTEESAVAMGAVGLMHKPFSLDSLEERIASLLPEVARLRSA